MNHRPLAALLSLCLWFCAAACGQEGAAAALQGQSAQQMTTITNTPHLPPLTSLSAWSGTDFFQSTSSNFWWVITRSPDAPTTNWRAYGVDLSQQQVVFRIELTSFDELSAFNQRIGQLMQRFGVVREGSREKLHYGSMGQLNTPPPPPPIGPEGDGWAAALVKGANNSASVNAQLMSGGYGS